MSGEAVEYVRGIPVVKMFQQTVYSFKAFYAAIRDYSDLASQYAMSCRVGQTCFLTFINGAFALLIPAALLLASGGDIRTVLVNFIFYALFAPACGQMINRIMYMSEAVMEADEAVGRLEEILSRKPMEESNERKSPANAAVSFDHVTFTYPGAERPALKDVSFSVLPGRVTALVGPSGGGKTTAASLIPRFWDADRGTVSIGGVDVREMDTDALMKQVAFVFQDTRLFKESLWRTSGLPDRRLPERRFCLPPTLLSAMTFWKNFPGVWILWWGQKAFTSPEENSSGSPWPAPS